MKVRKSLIAAGAAVGILAGCAAPSPELPPSPGISSLAPGPDHSVSPQTVKDDINQAYSEVKNFWASAVKTAPPSLAMPENETIVCGTETVTPAKGREVVAAFCNVTNTLVVWPEAMVQQISPAVEKGAVARTAVALIIKHEYGHFVQKDFNVIGHAELRPIIEPQADCLAGAAMQNSNADAQASVKIYYDSIDARLGRADTLHGSADSRLANFMIGYAPQDNRTCDNVTPLGS